MSGTMMKSAINAVISLHLHVKNPNGPSTIKTKAIWKQQTSIKSISKPIPR